MENKIYGYARCGFKTTEQDKEKLVKDFVGLGVPVENIFIDIEYTTTDDNPQYIQLFSKVNEGDTIITTGVINVVKTTRQLCELIELVKDRHLKLIIGTTIIDCTKDLDETTKGMIKMMLLFHEMESDLLSHRVKSGMAQAKANGVELGRPKWSIQDIPKQFMEQYELYKNGEITKAEIHRNTGFSRPTIDKYIKSLQQEGK